MRIVVQYALRCATLRVKFSYVIKKNKIKIIGFKSCHCGDFLMNTTSLCLSEMCRCRVFNSDTGRLEEAEPSREKRRGHNKSP